MRGLAGALLLLAACDRNAGEGAPAEVTPAAITFVGAQADKVAHGKRLTYVLGCRGCHGDSLQGEQFAKDHPEYGPIYASNLTRAVAAFSNAELEAVLRDGTHPTRKVVWAMPSEMYHGLSSDDMAALLAYLRTLDPAGAVTPPPKFSPLDRKDIASGEYKPAPGMIAAALKDPPADHGAPHALGRYIANTTCIECHGSNLKGRPNDTPDLVVASAYTRDEFEKLMTTGVPTGGRKLGMMAGVARGRFSQLTRQERDALYNYLKARAERPQ